MQIQEISTSARKPFRFTLRQLSIVVAVVALLAAMVARVTRDTFTIRPSHDGDRIRESYFGIGREGEDIRNIAIAKGTFSRATRISLSLAAVQESEIHDINTITLGRSTSLNGLRWKVLTIAIALGTIETPSGRIVNLGGEGFSHGNRSGEYPVSFSSDHVRTLASEIEPGREYVVYVEGDTKIELERGMTIEEFSRLNTGNYLVVTAWLE